MPSPSRLVVLAPNWLGDAVMALPLLTDLHRAWPNTEIVVAARQSVAPLFAMLPVVAGTIVFDGGGGRHAIAAATRNVALLRSGNFDAALLLPNSLLVAWLAWSAGITQRWGFAGDGRGPLLTKAIARPRTYGHQVEYYQGLVSGLGLAVGDRYAGVVVPDAARVRAAALLHEAGVRDGQRFVVFAPGAAYGRAKQWLPARFAELAFLLAHDGVATVLVGASGDTRVCDEVARLARRQPEPAVIIDLSGRTDLATLAAVLSMAAAAVSNDSGAMHLAAAVGARVTAIFGPTDERKTSPLTATASAQPPRLVATAVWCRPCMLRECPIDHRCMSGISAQQVQQVTAL
ncbi:MAG: lipopolysaccharide heptosyltransferase II [Acidobacteria bacterium]|nr:lipopolysaccharide heptosyltransferase II [Acidobacteriota bacterium]